MSGDTVVRWSPVHVRFDAEGSPLVELVAFEERGLAQPLFDMDVERWLRNPASLLLRRTIGLGELVALVPAPPRLVGLVFHQSRCGSTLVTQCLSLVPDCVALAEPTCLEFALRGAPDRLDRDTRVRLLRALVHAMAAPHASRAVLKVEATQALDHELLRSAFPTTPRVFLHRDPVRVLAKNLEHIGGRLLPGAIDPARLGLPPDGPFRMPFEEYATTVLAALTRAMLATDEAESGLFVDHAELPWPGLARIAAHFDLELDEQVHERLAERARLDAKHPERRYAEPDVPADPMLVELVARHFQGMTAELARRSRASEESDAQRFSR